MSLCPIYIVMVCIFTDAAKIKASIYDRTGAQIWQGSLSQDSDLIYRASAICSLISSGGSVNQVCTGVGWRPGASEFLSWIRDNLEVYKMYDLAQQDRRIYLTEKMYEMAAELETADEGRQAALEKRIKNTASILNSSKNVELQQQVVMDRPVFWAARREDFTYAEERAADAKESSD